MARLGPLHIDVTHFTDPACPFAFSAEPALLRLRWHYGEGLRWRLALIVLTDEPGEAEKLAAGAPGLQRRYGMPIDPAPYPRPSSSEPASRAVVATRLHAPERADALLRRLRVLRMGGGLLDDPGLIEQAAVEAGVSPTELARWSAADETETALTADRRAARSPSAAARALDHKLGGPPHERRYTAPSLELTRSDRAGTVSLPGFTPVEAYEAAIANLAPELERRPRPESVEELLARSPWPLATAEVIAVTGLDEPAARSALARVAEPEPVGADCYWRLRPRRSGSSG